MLGKVLHMSGMRAVVVLLATAFAVSATAARLSSAADFVSTTCSVALDTFSRCSASLLADELAAVCCTSHDVLTNFNCFCAPQSKEQAQGMWTADARQAVLQCPGKGHVSEPIYCNAKSQQVTYWSNDRQSLDNTAHILETSTIPVQNSDLTADLADQLSLPTQMIACDGKSPHQPADDSTPTALSWERELYADALPVQSSMQGSNMMVELSVEVDPMTDEAIEQSFTFTRPSVAKSVADLTAEVDFEIGPDVTRGEVEQILQGVTQWVSSMVNGNAESFVEYDSVQQSGDISSITTHVATVISQLASSLAGPNEDLDVEITYEFDLGAPEYGEFMSKDLAADDLAALRDSMTAATADAAVVDSFPSRHHDHHRHHMGHHKHRCLMQRTYRWLCHHKGFIQMALVVELVLCAVFGAVHLVWSLLAREAEPETDDSDLKKPLIEHAAAYGQDGQVTISPLWAHVMDTRSAASVV